jgi:hypothetical protein
MGPPKKISENGKVEVKPKKQDIEKNLPENDHIHKLQG